MRTYDRIDFLPMQTPPENIFNTFTGYEALKYTNDDNLNFEDSLIYNHIKNLCNNNDESFNYTIKIIARKIQQPHKLTNILQIFQSEQGAGKDLFFNWLGNKIIGPKYYFMTEKADQLFGKFNSSLENKIIVVINETSGKDTFNLNENIKNAITAHENIIEHKGQKAFKNTNHIQYFSLTNNDNPLKVAHDDRRIIGLQCNNKVCNNKEYFKNLVNEMESNKYNRAFYDYLLNIDCSDYDFTNNRPITEFYNDMKELNMPIMVRFLKQNVLDKITTISGTKFYEKFNGFLTANNYKFEYTPTKFGIDIKKYDGVEYKLSNGIKYIINIEALKQHLINKYKVEFYDGPEFLDNDEDEEEYDLNDARYIKKFDI